MVPTKSLVSLMGQMMDMPLLISQILEFAATYHAKTPIVSRRTEGDIHSYTVAECAERAKQVAKALDRLKMLPGDRIGTLAWNGYRHLEIYYGVSGSEKVCHTINPRLFPDQIAYIINHADDQVVFFDTTFTALVEGLIPQCPGVKFWISLSDAPVTAKENDPFLYYESLIANELGDYVWPVFDENSASSLCYTSGTTGNPKGALYSHRSTLLHAMTAVMPDALGLSAREVAMPVVPMFHVNAWGIPYAALIAGSTLVLPGPKLDGESLCELIEKFHVTMSAGVPTIWAGLLQYVQANQSSFSSFKRIIVGGSACPPAMMQDYAAKGIEIVHLWGMTEMSPIGTAAKLKGSDLLKSKDEQFKLRLKQGRPVFGISLRIVDGDGNLLPNDGVAFGDLQVKGPWVIKEYYQADTSALVDGWFPTGDVSTIDEDGYMQITDRSKDVIKSGGEWISSIEIENLAAGHPAVMMAACISAYHPKWDERPLLIIQKKPNISESDTELKSSILEYLVGKIAKWWMPDDVVFVDSIPLTATGKMQKLNLREQFKKYRFPNT